MPRHLMLDANEAVASIAYRLSEVVAIYPITPSSGMAELSDEWASHKKQNLWGGVPQVVEMQSEGGAAGAVHGALQGGALTTTFTASQGLLLMIPNMYKIAGELLPFCMHVSARALATHALSIFGDHSDVMACRQTGFAMLASGSAQEAQDLALVAHAATLRSRIPFLHFFDGFRTSHEVAKVLAVEDETLRGMVDQQAIENHRQRGLTPDHPVLRGSAHNPDTFFQGREAFNPFMDACAGHVRDAMTRFAKLTGRSYRPFDYVGHPQAERVMVMMGSAAEAAHELVEWMCARGEKVGLIKVRLYRPFSLPDFLGALPASARRLAVLDRTKEAGALGEPLMLDVIAALDEARDAALLADRPRVVGGRYGLGSKELTPAMLREVFVELSKDKPKRRFTLGIVDDVTGLSLPWDKDFTVEPDDVVRAVLYGLGSDGTVGANKNTIKILGEEAGRYAQGYFVYDSKKSGAMTVSHLRFGPRPIRSSYLVRRASLVAVHHFGFFERLDVLGEAEDHATLLVNVAGGAAAFWDKLPREAQQTILDRHLKVYAIDAADVAKRGGMGGRINTVMQTCFFAVARVLPEAEAIASIKRFVAKTYKAKGQKVVDANFAVIDDTLAHLEKVKIPEKVTASKPRPPTVPKRAPEFVQRVTAALMEGHGDLLPVSAFPVDGTWPTGTSQWEKRDLAIQIPVWDSALCIQCNKCTLECPHAAIRAKVYPPEALAGAPDGFQQMVWKGLELKGSRYTIQVATEDCTGCGLCAEVCPAKDKSNPRHKSLDMAPATHAEADRNRFDFFLGLPEVDRTKVSPDIKGTQLLQPLFEFSGACSGCGETPYVKLMTQLFGDRLVVANATGCSSIYGGNLPTTPYTKNSEGRGPAWANSLFEDNAEFGLGIRLALDSHATQATDLLRSLAPALGDARTQALLEANQAEEAGIIAQRSRVMDLRQALTPLSQGTGPTAEPARRLLGLADHLVRKSVWIVGGDGWAYDIGYGGLDHVLASGRNVKVLVLDTEVYSNTGGQQSKATPLGAAAKFAASGKSVPKKDLGLLAMAYGHVYVARVALGAKDAQTLRAFQEAESFPGPALIIAYSPCIAHGYDLVNGLRQQKLAVETGYWPLYRFDPRRGEQNEPPLRLDSGPPKGKVADFARNETRFRMVEQQDPKRFAMLLEAAQENIRRHYAYYEHLAAPAAPPATATPPAPAKES